MTETPMTEGGLLFIYPVALQPAFSELHAWWQGDESRYVGQPITLDGTTPWGYVTSYQRQRRAQDGARDWIPVIWEEAAGGGAAVLMEGISPASLTSDWSTPLDDTLINSAYANAVEWVVYADGELANPVPAFDASAISAVKTLRGDKGEVDAILGLAGLEQLVPEPA